MIKKNLALCTFLGLALFYNSCGNKNDIATSEREERLIKEGDELVVKIEKYKEQYHKLPLSLQDIGIKPKDDDELYYIVRKDSLNYIVWFGTVLGESITYYSDSKKWEDRDR